jgi:O-antigen biosynthesis protein WbqP
VFHVAASRKDQGLQALDFVPERVGRHQSVKAPHHLPNSIDFGALGLPDRPRGYRLKRLIDVGASAAGLAFVFPLILFGWLAVKATSPGPGLYWSERVGFGGRTFMMPKLRSMTVAAPQQPREGFDGAHHHITRVGAFLRRTSIDELPQLWSVFVGHMSLIGPRPLLPEDPGTIVRARQYPEVFHVRPGITGLSQVNGRNHVHARRKARYDCVYARRCTFRMDIFILRRTARVVLLAEGIL